MKRLQIAIIKFPGPYVFMLITLTFSDLVTPNMMIITSLIAKSSVVYNPLVYVAFNKKFRKDFFRALKCQYQQSEMNTTPAGRASSAVPETPPANAG